MSCRGGGGRRGQGEGWVRACHAETPTHPRAHPSTHHPKRAHQLLVCVALQQQAVVLPIPLGWLGTGDARQGDEVWGEEHTSAHSMRHTCLSALASGLSGSAFRHSTWLQSTLSSRSIARECAAGCCRWLLLLLDWRLAAAAGGGGWRRSSLSRASCLRPLRVLLLLAVLAAQRGRAPLQRAAGDHCNRAIKHPRLRHASCFAPAIGGASRAGTGAQETDSPRLNSCALASTTSCLAHPPRYQQQHHATSSSSSNAARNAAPAAGPSALMPRPAVAGCRLRLPAGSGHPLQRHQGGSGGGGGPLVCGDARAGGGDPPPRVCHAQQYC